ncbi:MAG: ABC transporter permease [Planctomycetota bacterium]|jgi:NitT/TauT family transport system permease protein
MIKKPIKFYWRFCLGVISIVVLLGAYTYLSHRQHIENPEDTTMPTWTQLKEGVKSAIDLHPRTEERWIVVDSVATISRLFLGLLFGVVGAIIIGLLMGCFPAVESFCAPPLSLLAKVPPTAALAVFFVLVGTDMNMYVAMIAFGVLPVLAQTVYLSVKEVPDELIYKAYTLGASHSEVIWNVICRQVLPKLIDTTRLQIGPAMVYLIAAEMLVGDVGFGYRIRLQSRLLNMSVVYPYLAVLAGFGFGMDYSMRWIQRLCCPWYTPER